MKHRLSFALINHAIDKQLTQTFTNYEFYNLSQWMRYRYKLYCIKRTKINDFVYCTRLFFIIFYVLKDNTYFLDLTNTTQTNMITDSRVKTTMIFILEQIIIVDCWFDLKCCYYVFNVKIEYDVLKTDNENSNSTWGTSNEI
jgi:hypothetical protein